MSCSYADGLSPYENKGKLGLKEIFDSEEIVAGKIKILAEMIANAKHVVVHTGAGISTSAGIPDFRGPNGVWTLEEKGEKPELNISFDEAVPTKTHMALVKLVEAGKIQYIVSQNIDGLHLKSGLSRKYLSELHGNMFVEQCSTCKRQFVLKSATSSVGQKNLQRPCSSTKFNGRKCRGKTHDTILDWEHSLPDRDLELADYHSSVGDLSICLGTTLQITPSGNLPLYTKKQKNGKLIICNLQPTKHDKKADLVIHSFVDSILCRLLEHFNLKLSDYNVHLDPTKSLDNLEWTITDESVKLMKEVFREKFPLKRKSDQGNNFSRHKFPKKGKYVKDEIKFKDNCKKEKLDIKEKTENVFFEFIDKNSDNFTKIKLENNIENEIKSEINNIDCNVNLKSENYVENDDNSQINNTDSNVNLKSENNIENDIKLEINNTDFILNYNKAI